ncbi:MAG: hypothetical protein EBY36_06105, partial [Gammaproteobacteria bacterium]|nr:hypothetical protein [Gammaproteobacteria bacterium]
MNFCCTPIARAIFHFDMSQTSSINRRGTTDRKARARERLAVSKSPAIRAGLEGGQYQPLSDSDIERV